MELLCYESSNNVVVQNYIQVNLFKRDLNMNKNWFIISSLLFSIVSYNSYATEEEGHALFLGEKYAVDATMLNASVEEDKAVQLNDSLNFPQASYVRIDANDVDLSLKKPHPAISSLLITLRSKNPVMFYKTLDQLINYPNLKSLSLIFYDNYQGLDISNIDSIRSVKLNSDHFSFENFKVGSNVKGLDLLAEIKSLDGIEKIASLERLVVESSSLVNYSALSKLKHLQTLKIMNTGTSTFPKIDNSNINKLILNYLNVRDPKSDSYLGDSKYTSENLGFNFENIDNITSLTGLKYLDISNLNADLTPLAKLNITSLTIGKKRPVPLALLKQLPNLKSFTRHYDTYENEELTALLNTKTSSKNSFSAMIQSGVKQKGIIFNGNLVPAHRITLDTYHKCHSNEIALNPNIMNLTEQEYMNLLEEAYNQASSGNPSTFKIKECHSDVAVIESIVVGK